MLFRSAAVVQSVHIPNDRFSRRAIEMERLPFQLWYIQRDPGEVYWSDGRLTWIETMSKALEQDRGADAEFFAELSEVLSEDLAELTVRLSEAREEHRSYFTDMIQKTMEIQQRMETLMKAEWDIP